MSLTNFKMLPFDNLVKIAGCGSISSLGLPNTTPIWYTMSSSIWRRGAPESPPSISALWTCKLITVGNYIHACQLMEIGTYSFAAYKAFGDRLRNKGFTKVLKTINTIWSVIVVLTVVINPH